MSGDTRSRRSDTTAAQMGEMLLKGYKMLATSCDICNNVLMQDRHGITICVACSDEEAVRSADMTRQEGGFPAPKSSNQQINLFDVEQILRKEITSTADILNSAAGNAVSNKLQYVSYIQQCAETIISLHKLK